MTDELILGQFLGQYESRNTRRAYCNDVSEFLALLRVRGRSLSAVDTYDLDVCSSWLALPKRDGTVLSPSTQRRKVKVIRTFLRSCVERGHINLSQAQVNSLRVSCLG